MFRPGGEHRTFKLTKDTVVIGRREDCDLRIPLSEISRKHSRLVKNGIGYTVEDMGSSNGTYVNGRRVQSLELEPGDTLQLGSIVFVLQVDGEPAISQMKPIVLSPKSPDNADSHVLVAPDDAGQDQDDELAILNSDSQIDLSASEVPTQISSKK
ncbi:MAG: FHA domain-containing protein [Tepidisphaeraceae bacterium]